jgi:hypothetical protein
MKIAPKLLNEINPILVQEMDVVCFGNDVWTVCVWRREREIGA